MSAGISGSDSKTQSKGNTNGTSTGTQTPNNLPQLQAGYSAATPLIDTSLPITPSILYNSLNFGANALTPARLLSNTGADAATILASGANGPNGANQYLTPFANGSMVNSSNPSFQNVLNQFANSAQAATDGSFAASGRYGSGANANAFNSAVANEAGQLGYTNYNQQQQNQLNAANILSHNNATSVQQQLAAAGIIPSLTSNLFTPATTGTALSFAPLLAYMQAIATGNPGGTQTSNYNQNTSGNSMTNTVGASVNAGFGGAPPA